MAGKSPAKKEQSQPLLPEQVEKPKLSWASTNMWPAAVAISLTVPPAAIYFGVQKLRDWRKQKAYKAKLKAAQGAQSQGNQSKSVNQGSDNLGPMQPGQSHGQGHSQSNNDNRSGSQATKSDKQKAEEEQQKKEEYKKDWGYWVRQNKLLCSAIVFGGLIMGGIGGVVACVAMVSAAYHNKRKERKWKEKNNPQLSEYQQNSFYDNGKFRNNLDNNQSQSQVQGKGAEGQVQAKASEMQYQLVEQQKGSSVSRPTPNAKQVNNKGPGQSVA